MEGRVFGSPSSDVNKLESVILGDQLPLAGDVNVSEVDSVQHLGYSS